MAAPPVAKRDIDQGYAWIIMTVVFFNFFICGMIFASFSVLYYDFMQAFDCSVGAVGWIISIYCVCLFTSGMLSDVAVRKFNTRRTSMTGAFVASMTLFGASFCKGVISMGTCYAITGVGMGICYVSVSSNLQKHFDKKRSTATGITVAGFSLVNCVGPLLTRFFLDIYGWRGCLKIMSGIVMQNVWLCILHRPMAKENEQPRDHEPMKCENVDINKNDTKAHPKANGQPKNGYKQLNGYLVNATETKTNGVVSNGHGSMPHNNENGHVNNSHALKTAHLSNGSLSLSKDQNDNIAKPDPQDKPSPNDVPIFNFRLLLNIQFLIYGTTSCLLNFGFVCGMPQIVNKALSDGIDKYLAAVIPSFFGAVNFVLRPILGVLITKFRINRLCMFAVSMMGLGACYICVGLVSTFVNIMVFIGAAGVFCATAVVNMHPVLVEIVGTELLTSALGLHGLFIAVGQLLAGPISGLLYDLTSSFDASLFVAGLTDIAGGFLLFILMLMRIKTNGEEENNNEVETAESGLISETNGIVSNGTDGTEKAVKKRLYLKKSKTTPNIKRIRTTSEQSSHVSSWSLA